MSERDRAIPAEPAPPAVMLSGESQQPSLADRERLLLWGILLVAAALRFLALGRQPAWLDESSTLLWAARPLDRILDTVRVDCQAPGYYLLQHFALAVLGWGEWQARFVSALAGTATVGLVMVIARETLSRQAAWIGGLLMALAPLHVHYSREARNYSLLTMLLVIAFVAAQRMHRQPGGWTVLGLALSCAIALYVHDVAGMYIAAMGVGFGVLSLVGPRELRARRVAAWAAAAALSAVLYGPWLPTLLHQEGRGSTIYLWAADLWADHFPWQIPLSLSALSHGSPPGATNLASEFPWSATIAAVVTGLAAIAALVRRRRFAMPDVVWASLTAGLGSMMLVWLYSWLRTPVYVVGRTDAPAQPFLVMLAAGGIATLPRAGRLGAALLLACFALSPVLSQFERQDTADEIDMAVDFVTTDLRSGDVLFITCAARDLFEYNVAKRGMAVDVRSFPLDFEAHPTWIDWSVQSDARLEREANLVVDGLAARAAAGEIRRAWVLIIEPRSGQALAKVLGKRFRYIQDTDHSGWRVGVHLFDLGRP